MAAPGPDQVKALESATAAAGKAALPEEGEFYVSGGHMSGLPDMQAGPHGQRRHMPECERAFPFPSHAPAVLQDL